MTIFPTETNGNTVTVRIWGGTNQSLRLGHAAAIAPNGYFLTAAHLVAYAPNYLFYSDGQSAKIAVPRLVAKVTDRAKLLDFAIIHIDANLAGAFDYARDDELQQGIPVITLASIGHSTSNSASAGLGMHINQTSFTGRVSSVKKSAEMAKRVCSRFPSGDLCCGGPVATMSGRLLGVHFGTSTPWIKIAGRTLWSGKPTAFAIRPSPSWIATVIEHDRQAPAHQDEPAPPPVVLEKDAPVLVISLD